MTKADLVNKVAAKTGLTKKDAGKAVEAVFSSISEALGAGQKVSLVGFGTFVTKSRAARTGRNPQTGKKIKISARRVPSFKAGKTLKETVAK